MRTAVVLLAALSFHCHHDQPAQAREQQSQVVAGQVPTATATATAPIPNEPIRILEPVNGAVVTHRAIVRGTTRVAGTTAPKVWVVVRPMASNVYWVQPQVDADRDGTWSVQIYVGREDASHHGEHFKIMAVANPRTELHEQDRLTDWPEAQAKSQIVEVVKQ